IVTALVAMLAISVPLASSARKNSPRAHAAAAKRTWVSPGLLTAAKRHPARLVHVIIQSTTGSTSGATQAFTRMDRLDGTTDRENVNRRLGSIDAVAVTIRADKLRDLASRPNLI